MTQATEGRSIWWLGLTVVVGLAIGGSFLLVHSKRVPSETADDSVRILVSQIGISDNPLHDDYTSAVVGLIDKGDEALPAVIPLLLSNDRRIAERAYTVVDGVIRKRFGFEPGVGWKTAKGEEEFEKQWKLFGTYDRNERESRLMFSARVTNWFLKSRPSATNTIPGRLPVLSQ